MRIPPWLIALLIAVGAVMENGIITQQHASPEDDLHDGAVRTAAAADGTPDNTTGASTEPEGISVLPTVRTMHSQAQPIDNTIVLQARTEADRKVTLAAEMAGQIAEILVRDGDLVTEGQIIARIETRDREAALAEARALLAQSELEYSQAVRLNAQGFRATTDVRIQEAALESARAMVERAEINLAQLTITAPFSGVLNDVIVELGDLTGERTDSWPGRLWQSGGGPYARWPILDGCRFLHRCRSRSCYPRLPGQG